MDNPIPFRLRIGVTGHRKLDQVDSVRSAVERLLDQVDSLLAQENAGPIKPGTYWDCFAAWMDRMLVRMAHAVFPHVPVSPRVFPDATQTPVEWIVVSSLARGADQVVAEIAMDRKRATLEAVLPMPVDEYRKDFVTSGDLAEFNLFFARAERQQVLSPASHDSAEPESRNRAYFEAGKVVVDSSDLVLVIWDGEPARGKGGTGDIVEYALQSGKPILWLNSLCPGELAQCLLPDPRSGTSSTAKAVPLPVAMRRLLPSFHALAAYNRDCGIAQAEWAGQVSKMQDELRAAAEDAGISANIIVPALGGVVPQFARADLLAIRYQQLHERSVKVLFVLAATAVSMAAIQAIIFPATLMLTGFEVLAMLGVLALLRISRREQWHEKWLHDRNLAESLRAQIFVSVLPEPSPLPVRHAKEVMPYYEGPSGWVSGAFHRILARIPAASGDGQDNPGIRRFLAQHWIRAQADYHRANAQKKNRASHAAHRTGLAFFCLTLIAAVLHLAGLGHGHADGDGGREPILPSLIVTVSILLPVWGTNIYAINSLLERDRLAKRSARMAGLLNQLGIKMDAAHGTREIGDLANTAALAMVSENYEWVASLSFRRPVLPG